MLSNFIANRPKNVITGYNSGQFDFNRVKHDYKNSFTYLNDDLCM